MRVALGSIARQLLEGFGITIASHVTQIKDIKSRVDALTLEPQKINELADQSPVRCLAKEVEQEMIKRIESAKAEKNTVGGVFEVIAIAQAMMSIQAIKSVEIGLGKEVASRWGSEAHDEIYYNKEKGFYRKTARAGGTEGGVSTGTPIIVRAAMKPLSTLMHPLDSVDIITKEPVEAHIERSDVCAVPAASIVGEAVLALVLADAFLEKFGGDSVEEIEERYAQWQEQSKQL